MFAKPIFEGSVTIFMKTYMAIRTVEEGIVLLVVRTETGCTGSFEYAFVVFARLLTFLAADKLFKVFLVGNRFFFFFVERAMKLNFV